MENISRVVVKEPMDNSIYGEYNTLEEAKMNWNINENYDEFEYNAETKVLTIWLID